MNLWIAVTAIAIAVVLGLLLRCAWPPSGPVRVRNALLGKSGSESQCAWTPAATPPGFRVEHHRSPDLFTEAVRKHGLNAGGSDWVNALRIATHLVENAKFEGPIQASLETTYQRIREGHGYCADHAKVYLALAHVAGLFARQWAFSFDGFGGHGHVTVEVFDRQHNQWRWIDVYNNFHAIDPQTQQPLSALEARQALLGTRPMLEIALNGPGRPGYEIRSKAIDYYRRGAHEWYLWLGNDVLTYDAHPLVKLGNRIAGGIGQAIATVLGMHPRLLLIVTAENQPAVDALGKLRRSVVGLSALLVALLGALIAQLVIQS